MWFQVIKVSGQAIRGHNLRKLPEEEQDRIFHNELIFVAIVLFIGLLFVGQCTYNQINDELKFQKWQQSGYQGPRPDVR